ncbi:MAG: pyridoxamine 5'-phosphate oxidase family protein [Thiotrichales bacterium]|nr:pyridoxamine 5'-phosphate oxidase family protein [Thiotrichales bacterium]
MKQDQKIVLAQLIRRQRWAGLATVSADGEPLSAMVAYAFAEDFTAFYIHISTLSQHTKQMLERPKISLVIAELDKGEGDPQTLPRVSISGDVEVIERGSASYASIKNTYLERLPASEQLFGFGDFVLFQLNPQSLRFVGGFAQAHSGTRVTLLECAEL